MTGPKRSYMHFSINLWLRLSKKSENGLSVLGRWSLDNNKIQKKKAAEAAFFFVLICR